MKALNTNFQSLLVRLDVGYEPRSTDYETGALTTSHTVVVLNKKVFQNVILK